MMAWFFVQVWVLCLVAFLLGAAVTWVAFVRPLRRGDPSAENWPELPAWPGARTEPDPPAPVPVPEPAPPAADPALAVLDVPGAERRPGAGPGAAATDALDRLGIGPVIPVQTAGPVRSPEIPAQSGPAGAADR